MCKFDTLRVTKNEIPVYLKPNYFLQMSEYDSSSLQSCSTDYIEDDTQNGVQLKMLTKVCNR